MTIRELAEILNERAMLDGFAIGALPELRKKYLHKKQLPAKLFTQQTIFEGERQYIFHHGGRDEMQFNVGRETFDEEKKYTRYALCFSLEASRSLPDPVKDLEHFRKRFDHCFSAHPELFKGFKMWYYQNNERYGNFMPQQIPDDWFQYGTFICIGNIIKKRLSELNDNDVNEILSGFDKLLPIYEYCVLNNSTAVEKVKVFTRLTSNENKWELPSPHRWRKENQGKKNIAFENQYGFGHEEWLMNPRYNVNGFQYGYIRGIENAREGVEQYNEVHLYTVKKEKANNLVYYIGHIKNLISIRDNETEQRKIQKVVERYKSDMMKELEYINADINGMIKFPFWAVVKFRVEDVSFFEEPIYQPNFDLEKYKRFQPYQFHGNIEDVFETEEEERSSGFVSGKSSQTTVYNRKNKEASVTVEKIHSEIIDALELFLKPTYSLSAKNLSIERTRFAGNIADVVTKENNSSITIYEVKTSASGRRNIRDAISQLLDYALHSEDKVNKLFIVSPSWLTKTEIDFLSGLKSKIGFSIEYLCYKRDNTLKFIKQ